MHIKVNERPGLDKIVCNKPLLLATNNVHCNFGDDARRREGLFVAIQSPSNTHPFTHHDPYTAIIPITINPLGRDGTDYSILVSVRVLILYFIFDT